MRIGKVPRHMKDGPVSLRPLSILDGPFLQRMVQENDILSSSGLDMPLSAYWVSIWWWMRKRYDVLYIVEHRSERAGVIGLYNLTVDTAELSLVIPDNHKRRLGAGSSAFRILEGALEKSSLIRTVAIRVRKDNDRALLFWKGLGFKELHVSDEEVTMTLHIRETIRADKSPS